MTLSILLLILLSLVFDFLNGFHDSANSIATVVSTRVLTPRWAVVWAAFFNFIAFLFFGLHVANTIGKGIIDIAIVDKAVIFATLIGACSWDVITWYLGLPTSSSHALIGGMIGAALVKVGSQALVWNGITKTVVFIFVSPILGLVLGTVLGTAVYWVCRNTTPRKVDHLFRKGQLLSAALYSMGHGGNDAQKTMGIITSLLFSAGVLTGEVQGTSVRGAPVPRRDRVRHHVRRLADRQDDGPEGGQTEAGGRLCRRIQCGADPGDLFRLRHPGQHHAHDHRGDHGRGVDSPAQCRPLGRGSQHHLGLDSDDSRGGAHLRSRLSPGGPLPRGHGIEIRSYTPGTEQGRPASFYRSVCDVYSSVLWRTMTPSIM